MEPWIRGKGAESTAQQVRLGSLGEHEHLATVSVVYFGPAVHQGNAELF